MQGVFILNHGIYNGALEKKYQMQNKITRI